jgi:hypothetical protein
VIFLASEYGLPQSEAVARFIEALLQGSLGDRRAV